MTAANVMTTPAPELPGLKLVKAGGDVAVTVDCPDPTAGKALLAQAMGNADVALVDVVLSLFTRLAQRDGIQPVDQHRLNGLLAQLVALEPQHPGEVMLCAQMVIAGAMVAESATASFDTAYMQASDLAVRRTLAFSKLYCKQMAALSGLRAARKEGK